mmetsp:Transcript_27556/g.69537  ORF Transcript_27556/g.69537 Transcript_27556/m.69537 type:complete len:233 (+) Transcript_27556:124-822(+)
MRGPSSRARSAGGTSRGGLRGLSKLGSRLSPTGAGTSPRLSGAPQTASSRSATPSSSRRRTPCFWTLGTGRPPSSTAASSMSTLRVPSTGWGCTACTSRSTPRGRASRRCARCSRGRGTCGTRTARRLSSTTHLGPCPSRGAAGTRTRPTTLASNSWCRAASTRQRPRPPPTRGPSPRSPSSPSPPRTPPSQSCLRSPPSPLQPPYRAWCGGRGAQVSSGPPPPGDQAPTHR